MHHNELWQVFADNGAPLVNKGAEPEVFEKDQRLNMGNVHIWFWKINGKTVEIMLQRRALSRRQRPGWYHASASGHINVGEAPVDAAIREAQEEMGIEIEGEKLFFVQAVRTIHTAPRDIKHVYLYRLKGDEQMTYLDGEVDSYKWRTLDNFKEITKDAATHNLIPQGELYFGTLIAALEYLAMRV